MDEVYFIDYCWSAKDALNKACLHYMNNVFVNPVEGPLLTTHNGYRAYTVAIIIDEYAYISVYVMVSLPVGATMWGQAFTADPVQMGTSIVFCQTTEDVTAPWAACVAAFAEVYEGVVTEFVEEVCEAYIEVAEVQSLLFGGDEAGIAALQFTVVVDANICPMQAVLTGSRYPFEVGAYSLLTSYRSPVSEVTIVSAPQADLTGITKALEDIALQEYEIGLNNGQSIFRVRGKATITGPGGGGGGG